jgi:hypothetical protein
MKKLLFISLFLSAFIAHAQDRVYYYYDSTKKCLNHDLYDYFDYPDFLLTINN